MVKPKLSRQQLGQRAEQLACDYLRSQGWQLVCTNYHCTGGEIDLVMSQGHILACIEVRYRSSRAYGSALESVSLTKQKKVLIAAQHFLHHHVQFQSFAVRFDVIAIQADADGETLDWIPHAFSC
ncbi:YraN family protein [Agitococcus lubricus]|uniref:UPF0102 protein C8N29_105212 n=1 Tax=Agitococcus lubricus TaxID=1077255 RepID=A0A2T5J0L6_9GAMM|nr:YraN family protein [Agitococcus lubricus]PTQ89883.1 putative endonuclease [Agitococcus lubricus]